MANNMNLCVFSGNLTRDAELKHIASGTALCNFSIANNVYQGQERGEYANYFDFVMWGKRAEALNEYLTKGTGVIVHCEARQDRWEKDGNKRSKVKFTVVNIEFKGGKRDGDSSGGGSGQNRGAATASVSADGGFQDDKDDFVDDDFDDNIPFN